MNERTNKIQMSSATRKLLVAEMHNTCTTSNLELFLFDLHLKTWKQNLNGFSDTNSIKYKDFQ